jgi:molybdopterin-guanine dinucleotide biosynthesis protein A
MTGIILAGGKSSRMKENKAFLEIEGERLIDRTVRIFKELFQEIILVTNSPLDYLNQSVTIVTDMIPDKGVPGGIYTGLFYSSSSHAFVAPCDMPFLNRRFVKYMLEAGNASYDVVVPETTPGLQPLHAVYSRNCLRHIKILMDAGEFRVIRFYHKVRILKIPEEKIFSFDPELKMFFNVNSPEDFGKIS